MNNDMKKLTTLIFFSILWWGMFCDTPCNARGMVWPTSVGALGWNFDLRPKPDIKPWDKKRHNDMNPYTGSHQSRTDFVLVYVPYGDVQTQEPYRMDDNIDDDSYETWYKKGVKDVDSIRDSDFVWKLQYTG
jgi:hypothetical protein